jgi:hypothetical protein
MSSNTRFMPYPPDAIFAVLADGDRYADWVVGTRRSAGVDPRWPQPGSSLLHQQGIGPLRLTDTTTVVSVESPRLLELEARVRPLVVAHVSISIAPLAGGGLVRIEETIVGGALEPMSDLLDRALHRRNAKALERLERAVAEPAPDRQRRATASAA